jgi:hypothetical protein
VAQIRGRSIMVHAGGDNYSDSGSARWRRRAHRLRCYQVGGNLTRRILSRISDGHRPSHDPAERGE